MKKILTYISILGTLVITSLLVGSVIIPNVQAQDNEGVRANATIDSFPCDWTGTPGLSTSDLNVADGDTCILTGTLAADNVTVETDGGSGGGILIVGSDTVDTDTVFTIHGSGDFQGTVEVGRDGNPSGADSKLATNAANIEVTTSSGSLTIKSSSGGNNEIDVDGKLSIGTSSTSTGSFTLADDTTTNIVDDFDVYSTVNLNNGTFDVDSTGNGVTHVYTSSASLTVGDNAIFNSYELHVGRYGTNVGGTFTNTGEVYITRSDFGVGVEVYKGTIYNNNPSDNSVTFDIDALIIMRGDGTTQGKFQNNGIVDIAANKSITMYEYALLDLDNGTYSRFIMSGSSILLVKGDTSGHKGRIEIESGATLSTPGITLGQSPASSNFAGEIVNNGTIDRIDTSGNPLSSGTSLSLWHNSTVDNYGTTDLYSSVIYLYETSTFTNQSTGTVTHNQATINVRDSSTLDQYGSLSVKNLYIGEASYSGGTYSAKNGSTTTMEGDVYVGNSSTTGGTLTIESGGSIAMSSSPTYDVFVANQGTITANGQIDIGGRLSITDGGTVAYNDSSDTNNIGSIEMQSPDSAGTSTFTIGNSVPVQVNDKHINCGVGGGATDYCSIEIGTDTATSGSSDMVVGGPLTVPDDGTYDVDIEIGSGGRGELTVNSGASMTVQETSGEFFVRTPKVDGGLRVGGTVTLQNGSNYMKMNNIGGHIKVDRTNEEAVTPASLITGIYEQSSTLEIEDGESMTINGTADIDGTSYVDGTSSTTTLTITECAILSGGSLELKGANAEFYVNTTNAACTLSGRVAAEGFVVQGTFKSIAASSTEITRDLIVEGASGEVGEAGVKHFVGDITVNGDVDNNTGGLIRISGELCADQNECSTLTPSADGAYTQDSSSTLDIDDDGEVFFGDTATIDGTAIIGDSAGTGAGLFECTTTLNINGNADITAYKGSTITVHDHSTAATHTYGWLKLDGTLNSGDLTVYSAGQIQSLDSSSTTDNQPSEFYINADDLSVNSSGKISSDYVSEYGSGYNGSGGSYGGEGTGRGTASGGNTYGPAKFTWSGSAWSDTPYYGERGLTGGGATGKKGGGVVRIKATGDILIDGIISANGESDLSGTIPAGAGGTVIIVHDIDHTDTGATFSGSGTIRANGGNGTKVEGQSRDAGGGGRIVIDSILFDDPNDGTSEYGFSGILRATGGTSPDDFFGDEYAAAGTIYLTGDDNNVGDSPSTAEGTLIVDQVGNAPNGTPPPETYITSSGDYIFNRVEPRNGALINFASAPTYYPTACYDHDGTVAGDAFSYTCNNYDDKPDTLYINTTANGAQSNYEPSVSSSVTVNDLTPEFSVVYRNPDTNTTHVASKLQIQVDNDSNFASPLWDYTKSSIKEDGGSLDVDPGDRTQDVEYDEDDTATDLAASTDYYVRARFLDASDNDGLWTHKDMGNHYKFQVGNYADVWDDCSGAIDLGTISPVSGSRYGSDSCDIHISSSYTDWGVDYGMNVSEGSTQSTAFDDGSGNYIIPIDNATPDCEIETDGTGSEEEYGFHIQTYPNDPDGSDDDKVHDAASIIYDDDCNSATAGACGVGAGEGAYNDTTCYFDIDVNNDRDQIIRIYETIIDGMFTLWVHGNINWRNTAGTYTLNTVITVYQSP